MVEVENPGLTLSEGAQLPGRVLAQHRFVYRVGRALYRLVLKPLR